MAAHEDYRLPYARASNPAHAQAGRSRMSGACFVASADFPGCVTSARHAAAVLGVEWAQLDTPELPPTVRRGTLLVLCSWTEAYERLLDLHDGPIAARWHSPLLQTELSREGWKLARILELLEAGRLTALAVSDAGVAAVLDRPGVVLLPEVFDQDELAQVVPARLDGINVSLFGEPYGRKNLLAQSAAFAIARRARPATEPWTLHLAGQTKRVRGYRRWLELARVSYVDHGRLPRQEYLALAAAMDAALAATVSESFGYVAAEALALGVPAVLSSAVACADGGELEVRDPGDVEGLARALQSALAEPQLAAFARRSLHERASANAERARAGLTELLAVASR